MSFSWVTDSWSGPASSMDFFPGSAALDKGLNRASVSANFPTRPMTYQFVSQAKADGSLYEIPTYLPLKDLSVDKTPLMFQRGGYSGLPPTVEQVNQCQAETLSSQYSCGAANNARGPRLLGVYGP